MQAILFDLDDTLLDDRGATTAGFSAFVSVFRNECAYATDEEAFTAWRDIAKRHWIRYEMGELSFQGQRRCRVRDFLGRPLDDRDADNAFLVYQEAYEAAWRLLPNVAEFLNRTKHIQKAIITNGDRDTQLRKISVTGLADQVCAVITPADCGYWKPHLEIFRTALSLLDVEPQDCLMVGDDYMRDIEPAIRLGMRCFHVQPENAGNLLDFLPEA